MRSGQSSRGRLLTGVGMAVLLQACGGGANTNPATVSLSLSAGPSSQAAMSGYRHVWITITGMAYSLVGIETYSPTDPNWTVVSLPSAITVDLANLNQGTLLNILNNMQINAGNYLQMRLLLAPTNTAATQEQSTATTPLRETSTISTYDSNGLALQWNNQVEYTRNGSVVYEAPLEAPLPQIGLFVGLMQSFGNGGVYPEDLDINLDHALVPFNQPNVPGGLGFALAPQATLHNLQMAGDIHGTLDASKLCQPGGSTVNCANHVVAMAELQRIDANLNVSYFSVHSAAVNPVDGTFDLFPLDSNSITGVNYEVVLRGDNMQDIVINEVPVLAGSSPATTYYGGTNGIIAGNLPTELSTGVIPVTVLSGGFTPQPLKSMTTVSPWGAAAGYWAFMQTPTGYFYPFEMLWINTDPFTGMLPNLPETPQLSTGGMSQAYYVFNTAPAFVTTIPAQGSGAYNVLSDGPVYETTSPVTTTTPVVSATTPQFTPMAPLGVPTIPPASLTLNFSVTNSGGYDRGQLVFSDLAGIVSAVDLTSVLNKSTSTATLTLPTGSSALQAPGSIFYPYLRLWKSTSTDVPLLLEIPVINMSQGAINPVSVTIP